MMQTARATPAGAKSTAAQHTRAEMQQLRSQSHCKQHRSSPNGCSLNSTSMQLRLHHCYCCNIVQTTLATIATTTMTTGANIAPALCKCNRSCTHSVAPALQPRLQLQLLQDCDCHHCKFHGIGVAMMQTARATPAGAISTAAQHTRAEMQMLLRAQWHCEQHRSNHNGCSLIATSMQLRLHHCYHCNIVHTALQLHTTGATIAPATATSLRVQLQLQPHCCANISTATATPAATIMQSPPLQARSQLKCKRNCKHQQHCGERKCNASAA